MCLFNDDGTTFSINYNESQFLSYSKDGQLNWSKNIRLHHELEKRGEHILSLSEKNKSIENKNIRFDLLKIYDQRTGDEVASWDTEEHWDEILKILSDAKKVNPKLREFINEASTAGRGYEYTHLNSLKEIPPNDLYPAISYLKPGNLIVGMNCLGFFLFLDPSMSQIEGVYHYQQEMECNTHDAQVLASGRILFFRNYHLTPGDGPALIEIDPRLREEVWSFKTKNDNPMRSNSLGSVTKLSNGHYFYLDRGQADQLGPVEIRPDGEMVNALELKKIVDYQKANPYRARILDLKKYLENSL